MKTENRETEKQRKGRRGETWRPELHETVGWSFKEQVRLQGLSWRHRDPTGHTGMAYVLNPDGLYNACECRETECASLGLLVPPFPCYVCIPVRSEGTLGCSPFHFWHTLSPVCFPSKQPAPTGSFLPGRPASSWSPFTTEMSLSALEFTPSWWS